MAIKRSHRHSYVDATTGSKLAAKIPKPPYSKSNPRYRLNPGRLFENYGAGTIRVEFRSSGVEVMFASTLQIFSTHRQPIPRIANRR